MSSSNAKFIVLYGINNLGKTTQAKLLVNRFISAGHKAEYLKYPVYDIEPSGTILNNYLRKGNQLNLTVREAQIIYALNRTQFEYMLMQKLDDGVHVVAEDYVGTGLAWGIGTGVNENFLRHINSHLLKEDIGFLLDGERFKESTEHNHKHETQDELMINVRHIHQQLGREFGWHKINANEGVPQIHAKIWEIIKNNFDLTITTNSVSLDMSNYSSINHEIKIELDDPKTEDELLDYAPITETIDLSTQADLNEVTENITKEQVLKIEKISPLTKTPSRAHLGDAGLDIYSSQYYTLMSGEKALISTGIKLAIPEGCVGLVWDKSGIAKQGIHAMAGVIDSGYRGEVLVNLINLSNNIYTIAPGQKIAQLLIQKVETPLIIEDKVENNTSRGEGSFGSTGI
ncbi:dUTP diphosphatase [Patescibacteria group bacterium]|nr:dUTP diphosphatase [Patescibacteria group bacterium]